MASPLFSRSLSGLPPAIMVTAGHDMLRDEGRLYAQRLREAGVDTTHQEHPTLPHGFVNVMGVVPAALAAMEDLATEIKRLLS